MTSRIRGPRSQGARLLALIALLLFVGISYHAMAIPARGEGPPQRGEAASTLNSAEEELALKYNPVLRITIQTRPCTKSGNVYDPAPVEIILGNPDVELRRLDRDRTVIMTAPLAEDIVGLDEDHDLNWPGNPRRPGCVYERDYLRLTEETEPTVYVHIATERGVPGIAIQYWYNYYYNDFANKHEGDWEMVQIMFDNANTVEEALQQEPTRTAYSGHEGGELADWGSRKLQKEGTHPIVFVTTGAHAAHYSEGTFIGVAKRGQVFGCDPTTGPHRSVDPEVVLLPAQAPVTGEFAWLSFGGLWGEENGPLFSGVAGPATRHRWDEPFTWANGLRDFSDKIPDNFLGVDPVSAICALVNTGSDIMLFYGEHPWAVIGALLIGMGTIGAVMVYGIPGWLTGRSSEAIPVNDPLSSTPGKGFLRRERKLRELGRGALRIYAAYWPLWLAVGAVMLPVSLMVMVLDQILSLERLAELTHSTALEPASELIGMTLGAFIGAVIVSVAVFAALRDVDEGNRPSLVGAYRHTLSRSPSWIAEVVLYSGIVGLLSLTLAGLPFALNRAVAWAVAVQAIIMGDSSAVGSLRHSADLVKGNWWRVLGTIALIALFVGLPGPVIAFAFLIFTRPPIIETVYPVLCALYVFVLFPLGFIASGLLYGDLCAVLQRRSQAN